jgi:hypothetical protein
MYRPNTNVPASLAGFIGYVVGELQNIGSEFLAAWAAVRFKRLYKDPARMYPDMLVLFDATAPSAASGEGLYRRNAANSAWKYIG